MTANKIPWLFPDFLVERSIDWNDPQVRRAIGQALRQAREAEKLSLAVAADGTDSYEPHLEALENGEWDQLPFYGAGRPLTQKYAAHLGVDLDRFATPRVRVGPSILLAILLVFFVWLAITLVNGLFASTPAPLVVAPPPPVFADTTVSLSGSGQPGYQIVALVAGTPVASALVAADGTWSLNFELDPAVYQVTLHMSRTDSATPAGATSVAIAIATPTGTPTVTPTPTPPPAAAYSPSPTPLPLAAPLATSTPVVGPPPPPPLPTPGPEIDASRTRAFGTTGGKQNTPYSLGIDVDNVQKEVRVEMMTKKAPPNLVYDMNIFIANEEQKEAIFRRGVEPQEANIGAGVIKPDSEGRVVQVTVGQPVGELHLIIFNRSPIPAEYELVIYNGRLRYDN